MNTSTISLTPYPTILIADTFFLQELEVEQTSGLMDRMLHTFGMTRYVTEEVLNSRMIKAVLGMMERYNLFSMHPQWEKRSQSTLVSLSRLYDYGGIGYAGFNSPAQLQGELNAGLYCGVFIPPTISLDRSSIPCPVHYCMDSEDVVVLLHYYKYYGFGSEWA